MTSMIMGFLKEIIKSIKSGNYAGKGNRLTRKGDIYSALKCYQKALGFTDNDGERAVIIECILRSYARLGQYEKALLEAEKSFSLYTELDSSSEIIKEPIRRISILIEALNRKDESKVNKILTI